MKYIKGHTRQEYRINGFLFPKKNYSQAELDAGRKPYLAIDDETWKALSEVPMVKEMLDTGVISITSEAPVSTDDQKGVLETALRDAETKIAELEANVNTDNTEVIEQLQQHIEHAEGLIEEKDGLLSTLVAAITELGTIAEDKKVKVETLVEAITAAVALLPDAEGD